MKKATALVIVFLLSLSLFACSNKGEDKPIETGGGTEGKGFWGRAISIKDNCEEKFSEETPKVTVEDTELDNEIFDDGYITVTATNLSYEEFYGPVINFEVDNYSEHIISVESVLVVVNGCVFPATFYAEVPAYESTEGVLYLYENELNTLKISAIRKIDVKLNITDTETSENLGVSKLTSVYFNEETGYSNISNGDEILSSDGVTIYIEDIKKKDNESYDYVAGVFIGNINDRDISVSAEIVTVNGVEIEPNCIINVPAISSNYHELSFYKSTLKENGIDNIKEIIMSFSVYDAATNEKITDSERFMIIISDF